MLNKKSFYLDFKYRSGFMSFTLAKVYTKKCENLRIFYYQTRIVLTVEHRNVIYIYISPVVFTTRPFNKYSAAHSQIKLYILPSVSNMKLLCWFIKSELIDLQQNITLKDIFNSKSYAMEFLGYTRKTSIFFTVIKCKSYPNMF